MDEGKRSDYKKRILGLKEERRKRWKGRDGRIELRGNGKLSTTKTWMGGRDGLNIVTLRDDRLTVSKVFNEYFS